MALQGSFLRAWRCIRVAGCALIAGASLGVAHAQVPANPYDYTRTIGYTWQTNGALATQTVEPNNAPSCSVTTYGYDAYGNRSTVTTANCGSAVGRAKFPARAASAAFAAVTQSITVGSNSVAVSVPAGAFRTKVTNALSQQTTERTDPRFGAPLRVIDPNSINQSWTVDDFGRVTRQVNGDTTRALVAYCIISGLGLDTSSNSNTANGDPLSCPALPSGQAPSDAVSFTQKELHNAQGSKIGPYTRTFFDKLGRTLRVLTETFDGAGQPAALQSTLVAQDNLYSAYGPQTQATQPYFLSTISSTAAGSNDVGLTQTRYDDLGRPTVIYRADANGHAGSVSYSGFGARTSASTSFAYTGLSTTITNDHGETRAEERNANGDLARVTDANLAQVAYLRDAFGNLVATRDALQNQIKTQYDLLGHKAQLSDPDKGVIAYCYDAIGQLKAQQSSQMRGSDTPSACPNTDDVAVDATGKTATAVAGWRVMAYDALGRMAQRIEPEMTTTWTYDNFVSGSSCGAGIGRLCEVATSVGEDRRYQYDTYGRLTNQRTGITNGPSFASVWAFDGTTQRLSSQTYPTGLQVGYSYTGRGYLEKAVLLTSATVNPLPNAQGQTASSATLAANSALWTASVVNAWGDVEQEVNGNGVSATTTYDRYTGRTLAMSAGASGAVLSQSYTWDSLAHLTARADANGAGDGKAVSETFAYGDKLGRLTSYTVSAPAISNLSRTVALQYNALGMLLYKSDVGNYAYGVQNTAGVRPHALLSATGTSTVNYAYDMDGNLKTADGGKYRSLTYNSFDLPDSQSGATGPGGTPHYTWAYDEHHARLKELRVDASGTRTTWSLHPDNQGGLSFESETAPSAVISNRHYVMVGGRVIGVLVSTGALPTLSAGQMAPPALTCGTTCITLVKVEYWHKDFLGSLITTTDHLGTVTQRYAYDPFGKRRYTNGNYDGLGNLVYDWSPTLNAGTDRGFTGHEHVDDIGLVHMNGRIYDPTLGVFLQADPHITNPADLQNFERYAYCLNSPLTCTDPSGFDGECSPDAQCVVVDGHRPTDQPCNVTATCTADDIGDGGFVGGGGINSGPTWYSSMYRVAKGTAGRAIQQGKRDLRAAVNNPAVVGFVILAAERGGRALGVVGAGALAGTCDVATDGACAIVNAALVRGGAAFGGMAGRELATEEVQMLQAALNDDGDAQGATDGAGSEDAKPPESKPASGATRPEGVPDNWVEVPSRDGKGTKWVDPSNPKGGDYVRERGDGTLTQVKNGRALDSNGNAASGLSSPEAHFPRDQWTFRP